MNAITRALKPITDLWSLIVGLKITGKYFCKPQVTVHYPRQTVDADQLDTFGGHIELIGKPKQPEKPKCIACLMCMTACPSSCLTVLKAKAPKPTPEQEAEWKAAEEAGEKPDKPKAPKEPAKFLYDYTLCSLCGTCIEVCPVNSLRYSGDIYTAGYTRKEFKYDLLQRLAEQAASAKPAAPGAGKDKSEA